MIEHDGGDLGGKKTLNPRQIEMRSQTGPHVGLRTNEAVFRPGRRKSG